MRLHLLPILAALLAAPAARAQAAMTQGSSIPKTGGSVSGPIQGAPLKLVTTSPSGTSGGVVVDTTASYGSGKILSVRTAGSEVAAFDAFGDFVGNAIFSLGDYTRTNDVKANFLSSKTDGASSVAFQFTTNSAWSTSGGKLFQWGNNSVEKASVSYLGDFLAAGNPVPEVHSAQTTSPVAVEYFTQALTAGSATKTFATAFASAPVCSCTDQTAAAATKAVPTASNVALTGTSTDTLACICIGAK